MFSPERRDPFVLADLSDSIFRDGGSLFANMGFEHRPEQELMARMCSEAFETDSPLVFEAGTGVGKSLAYLVPGIIAAKRFRRQLVVATNTIALQEQLLRKDLPLVRLLFSRDSNLAEFADFKTAFLVGRANYLCTSRLKRAIAEKTELFRTDESAELERIAEWALCTKTGMVEELNPRPNWDVWNWVNADSSSCSPKKCPDGTCFYQKARKAVAGADVVILNHSLLFALIAAGAAEEIGTRGVLFADDMCVIDEAHLMPKVAAESFGLSISSSGMAKELRRIYDPLKKRGLITRAPSASVFEKESVVAALAAVENFFAKIRKENLVKKDTVRLASPEWTANTLEEPLSILAKNLSAIAARTQDESLSSEIKDYQRKVCAMKDAVAEAVYLGAEKHVYWLEKGGKDGLSTYIMSAPIDVAPILREVLFSRQTSVILSSATLATNGGSLESFVNKIGAECAEQMVCDSPFDYAKNMRILLCADFPAPDKSSKKLDCEHLAKTVERLCEGVDGGTLVLFTGYYEMNKTAEILYSSGVLKDRRILLQRDMPRTELIKRFEEHKNAILLGTDSFWTGIDVPGRALSQVIITRLPFDNPSHPLTEARYEYADASGGNSFAQLAIPDCIIKLRQGAGRLIRSKTDKGLIALLDSRLLSKPYGKRFLAALPPSKTMRFNSENLEEVQRAALAEIDFSSAE